MSDDDRSFHSTVRQAVSDHAATIDSPRPDFQSVLSGRRRHTRRLLAAATAAVAVLGVAGVVFATTRTQQPTPDALAETGSETGATSDAVVEPGPAHRNDTATSPTRPTTAPSADPTTTSVPEFFCSDPLGVDAEDRSLFGSCEPAGDGGGDYACTGRTGSDETGREIFTACDAVGQLGPIVSNDPEPDDPGDVASTSAYIVRPGDHGIKLAVEFCTDIAALEDANDWSDAARQFPPPDARIRVPEGFTDPDCDLTTYTITERDTARILVADDFCIGVQALDAANRSTDGYDAFFPGLEILVPPSVDESC